MTDRLQRRFLEFSQDNRKGNFFLSALLNFMVLQLFAESEAERFFSEVTFLGEQCEREHFRMGYFHLMRREK